MCEATIARTVTQVEAVREYLDARLSVVLSGDFNRTHVRAPLDVCRYNVISLCWRPLLLTDSAVGDQLGLLRMLRLCQSVHYASDGNPTAILVDENLHYRIHKLHWARTYQYWSINRLTVQTPILYGVWHAYKQVVLETYRFFHPFYVLLCRGPVPDTVQVASGPKLRTVELLMASLLLIQKDTFNVCVQAPELCCVEEEQLLREYQLVATSTGTKSSHWDGVKACFAETTVLFVSRTPFDEPGCALCAQTAGSIKQC
jgi:hypothetical protein